MTVYQDLIETYSTEVKSLAEKYNLLSYLRLAVGILFLVMLYLLIKFQWYFLFLGLFISVLVFVWLLISHQKVARQKLMSETLKKINEDEVFFLEGANIPFEDGREFVDPHHLFTYDLDVFGPNSLFQFLNRTATFRGGKRLADILSKKRSHYEIIQNQQAIAEVGDMLSLRQKVRALALINRDDEEHYRFLINWMKQKNSMHKLTIIAIYVLPVILILLVLSFVITHVLLWLNAAVFIFISNLILLGNYSKIIKQEVSGLDKLDAVIKHYGLILNELTDTNFESQKLRQLHSKIQWEGVSAGVELMRLATLLNQLDSVFNGMAVMLFSGTICFHLHVLKRLFAWKGKNATHVKEWLEVMAEFETLSSLANFKFNNPDFVFPQISEKAEISFKDLGHPLVRNKVRICNDINFNDRRFVILTGSNMSGKSTFLRSLGVNLILAESGSVVCASESTLYPFNVLVSMRVADSLAENESYFYAEVKRLKQITDTLHEDHALVLLDEILRGTNSDDKRNGTLEVIRKMVREGAYGVIATHDLEVCNETKAHPDVLCNKCFEVEIVDDELYFDYKLRDGICVNQSATFLMKKTGII